MQVWVGVNDGEDGGEAGDGIWCPQCEASDCTMREVSVLKPYNEDESEGIPCTLCGSTTTPLHTDGICGNCWTH
jgi:hypothetical protein